MPVSAQLNQPIQLLPLFKERVWGRHLLAPFFDGSRSDKIGEVWFTAPDNRTSSGNFFGDLLTAYPELLGAAADPQHPGLCPLLVKLLFTSERLSIQVHPDDEYARQHHASLGKTEAWYVLEAQPPGEVGLGFTTELQPEQFRQSAISGEIEQFIAWKRVTPGEVIFVPAGTVHAIGAGLTICEIQQNSDVTYRLYDYGRPRELHLEHGSKVSKLGPHESSVEPVPLTAWRDQLLDCGYFRIERLRPAAAVTLEGELPYYVLLICTRGSGQIAGQAFSAGQVWFVPAGNETVNLENIGAEWILTYTADRNALPQIRHD